MIQNPTKKVIYILSVFIACVFLFSGVSNAAGLTPTLQSPTATLDSTQSDTNTNYYVVNSCVYNNAVHFKWTFNKGLDQHLQGSTYSGPPDDLTLIKLYIKGSDHQQTVALDTTFTGQTGTGGTGNPIVLNYGDFQYTKDTTRTLELILKSTVPQFSTTYILELGATFQSNDGSTFGKTYKYEFTTCSTTQIGLSSFIATPLSKEVVLDWATASEIDNAGFNIYRAESEDGQYIKINDELIAAQGSSTEGASYHFIDKDLKNRKTYFYKLEDVDINGESTFHGPIKATPRFIYTIGK